MSQGPPLPLPREDARVVAVGVELVVDADGAGAVFVWGNAAWCWRAGDSAGRRLAAAQMVSVGAASQRQVAAAWGVNETTVWRWRAEYDAGGVAALAAQPKGPRRASKLTAAKVAEIIAARGEGLSMQAVADRVGVSLNSVSRALRARQAPTARRGDPAPVADADVEAPDAGDGERDDCDDDGDGGSPDSDDTDSGDGGQVAVCGQVAPLVALARPTPRTGERHAARAGALVEAPPVITQGAGLPLAGALTVLPALAATGLLDVAGQVYERRRAAFYGLRSLLLTLAFAAVVGVSRVEGLSRIDPVDLGRLVGSDRAPEVKTVRRRVGELAAAGRADRLIEGLARRHVDGHPEAVGVFYVDGHVRAYHGHHDVPKHHVARMRIAMPAEEDIWVGDARGDGLLVWQAPPGGSLTGALRRVAAQVRELVGPDARPTICFDRGGWSPRLFADLDTAGFDVLTYRKGDKTPEPDDAFTTHTYTDRLGRTQTYQLADRRIAITYKDGGRQHRLSCRQITRRSPNGHQTQIITTRTDDAVTIAYAMFSRWRQENFFRYMRHRYSLDALDAYATMPDDPDRTVPNPAKRATKRRADELAAGIAVAQAHHDRRTVEGGTGDALDGLADEIAVTRDRVTELRADAKTIPARVPNGELHPDSRRLDPERKRIHDAVRTAAYNAESTLARLLAGHYPRAGHEARTLLREIFTAPADIQIIGNDLHVRVHPLSAPRRTRALAGLCHDLTATRTAYPGTDMHLVYTVKTQ